MEQVKPKDEKQQVRQRAAAGYAYNDLDASIAVAAKMQEMQGGSCALDQLAQWLGYASTKSGTFQARISSAKQFGLVEQGGGALHVTDRAVSILSPVMPEDATNARADAFLSVELYGLIYDRYKGNTIPPRVGMRNLLMNTYGLSEEAVDKAMRVMYDSARQAGLFNGGDETRLVRPGIRTTAAAAAAVSERPPAPAAPPERSAEPQRHHSGGGGDGPPPGVHSAIVGLLRELPPPGSVWPKKGKDRFVKAFLATLDFVYQTDDENPAGAMPAGS